MFSPSEKMIVEEIDIYSKLIELEEKYNALLLDVKRLEEENLETTNALYELENRLQSQIDIHHPKQIDLSNYTLGDS